MSAVGLVKFNVDLAKVAEKIDVNLADFVRRIAIVAFTDITELTPVDTGRARASWDISLGAPSEFLPPGLDPVKRGQRKKLKAPDSSMISVANAQKAKAIEVLARADAKQPIYIMSNLPYIEALELGHSQQAPAGMVRITVASLEMSMEKYLNP